MAGPASSIFLSEINLLEDTGTFLSLPVQVHLNNTFLGKDCTVGTNGAPINIAFTSGTTDPPPPNVPIKGTSGIVTTIPGTEARAAWIQGSEIVNNEYAAPGVSGCGEGGRPDGALNAALGLPSPSGSHTRD